MNLAVNIGKLKLKNPIICASGTFGFGDELKRLVDFSSIGAVVSKTITAEPREGNIPPRIYETDCGVINSIGLANPGVDSFIKEKLPALGRLKTNHIISLGGFSEKEYKQLVEKLDKQDKVDAFELNLSCPNLGKEKLISQSQKLSSDLVKGLRKLTKKTLIVKLTPEVTDIVKIAKAVERAGADAISMVNTYFSLAIDIETKKPYLGNVTGGYSGPAIKPMSLYRVWKVANSLRIPVVGGGGITDYKDALEFLLAGAAAVSLGTINLTDPNAAKDILSGVKAYMDKNKMKKISDLRRSFNG
ncbi:MAG: dihydroorotate dehydrogenase [Candidatus Omnitrophica bacterium]|nr:dihydroorotate dehydrogenase [Candidatus Omnitrophota bacterium]MCF7891935.1 dihydroorotate dehydrogenase [Candidatus Omnitrophota bacterium]MCF7896200.1 dihydroorotate dehydrogenase [Candidatus Omnitrophota bacterium]MCF7897446.1 dihydroorotate dehydrogenase [Candidatus Omnitrophota bacterium]MCF7909376.1 dihydroorotate dehydrogenase [Candidatus Omnitrophota bacterium]